MIPTVEEATQRLGLVESITYHPAGWDSDKKDARWIHQFGDVGERGHGEADPAAPSPYPARLMPEAWATPQGHLVIRRRAGNRYTVDDWILA
jgi:hypothetical protein